MVATSKEQAAVNAEHHLNELADRQSLSDGERYVVLTDQIVDRGDHWCVPYQSADFVRTGEIADMLAGNWPLMVCKSSGKVVGAETPEWMEAAS